MGNVEQPYAADADGLFVPRWPVVHREDEYDPEGFELLRKMQAAHFWYLGRHRFLLRAVRRALPPGDAGRLAIDLGGGCGGWIDYLHRRAPGLFTELALGDSSPRALTLAKQVLGANTPRYQIDIMRLGWRDRWHAAFLLDVIEHIPDDAQALRQVGTALRPGGLLFVTTPALQFFWSHNDEQVHHLRRYSRRGLGELAQRAGLELLDARYFMFFLSPLLWLSRRRRPAPIRQSHQVPIAPVNQALRAVFSAETPLGHWLPFPWGTSILGVFRKPA